jgi:hypothetical protein
MTAARQRVQVVLVDHQVAIALDYHRKAGSRGGARRSCSSPAQPPARPERGAGLREDLLIAGVIEVPNAANQSMIASNRSRQGSWRMSPWTYSQADAALGRVRARPVEKQLRGVQAGYPATALGQPVGDAPVPTGQVQHLHARPQLQQPPDQIRFRVVAFLEMPGEEVEVVVTEHVLGIEVWRCQDHSIGPDAG